MALRPAAAPYKQGPCFTASPIPERAAQFPSRTIKGRWTHPTGWFIFRTPLLPCHDASVYKLHCNCHLLWQSMYGIETSGWPTMYARNHLWVCWLGFHSSKRNPSEGMHLQLVGPKGNWCLDGDFQVVNNKHQLLVPEFEGYYSISCVFNQNKQRLHLMDFSGIIISQQIRNILNDCETCPQKLNAFLGMMSINLGLSDMIVLRFHEC